MTSSIELWPQQEKARDFVLANNETALFFEQRTGKTFITLGVLDNMPRDNMAVVLVSFLNNKDSTWADKIAEFLPWLTVTKDWEEYKKLPCPKLYLLHFEELHTVATKIRRGAQRWINFAIIDEAHRLKNRGSRLSRAAAKLADVKKKLILTGTPIEKQPKDLWGQFRFLKPDLFGSWKTFEEEYMDFKLIDMEGVTPGTARWQIKIMQQGMLRSRAKFKQEKIPKLTQLIKPYSMRLEKEDVGILRPQIRKVLIPIEGRQRLVYDQMKKDSVTRVRGHRIMAPLAVTAIMKRRQIASGFVYDDDENCHHVGDAKLVKLISLFERLPKPIVVFTAFKPDHELIAQTLEDLGYDIARVSGATKKPARAQIWRAFQRAQFDGLVCQVRTGGVGVDLWKSDHAIVHSMTHSSIDFNQMASRLDNINKRVAAKIYVLCGKSTIDEDLYDMIVDKGMTSKEVLDQLKQGAQ